MSNGNMYLIKKGAVGSEVTVAGQLEGSLALGGTPVETTNKSSGGFIEYLDGFRAGKQVVFTGSFTLANDALLNEIKEAAESGLQEEYVIESGVGGESWAGKFVVARSDTAPLNGSSTMAVTFSTSGAYDYNKPTLA